MRSPAIPLQRRAPLFSPLLSCCSPPGRSRNGLAPQIPTRGVSEVGGLACPSVWYVDAGGSTGARAIVVGSLVERGGVYWLSNSGGGDVHYKSYNRGKKRVRCKERKRRRGFGKGQFANSIQG